MKKIAWSVLTAVVAVLLVASPAAAITYGEPDNREHPYVGFMIYFDPSTPGWFSCTGTLLDANTFLTAGHCTYPVGTEGGPTADNTGGSDVWVTFEDRKSTRL